MSEAKNDQERTTPRAKTAHKRRLRNYMLEPEFQVKYTSMVIGVAVVLGIILGYFAYNFSKEGTQLMQAVALASPNEAAQDVIEMAREYDRKVLVGIIMGVVLLVVVVSLTGIVITHRVVGPAYRIRMLMNQVRDGNWSPPGKLRQGDELQSLFRAFSDMLASVREVHAESLSDLDRAIESLSDEHQEVREDLMRLRQRLAEKLQ